MNGQKFMSACGRRHGGLILIGLAFIGMAALTWRQWPDVVVDFGTQLYIPWRILNGAVLYRDLYYFAGGPFSQYLNALLFKMFGANFSTLIAANLFFSAAMVVFVYGRFRNAADSLTATVMGVGIVVVFLFSQYVPIGNYNFIAPYSHEITHGVILSVFAIGLLADWLATQKLRNSLGAGFCTGLVFMTKPDVFLALAGCVGLTQLLFLFERRQIRAVAWFILSFGLAMLLPLVGFFGYFLRHEDWRTSVHSVLFGWVPVFIPAIRNNAFYRFVTGADHPFLFLQVIFTHFLWGIFVITVCTIVFRRMEQWKGRLVSSVWTIWLIVSAPLAVLALNFFWIECGYSLPLWCVVSLLILLWVRFKQPLGIETSFALLWSLFSLLLMSKLGFYPRIWHYGFALAMPAFALTIYLLLWLLPKFLEQRCQSPAKYLRTTMLVLIVIGFLELVSYGYSHYFTAKRLSVGAGKDRIVTYGPKDERGEELKAALEWIGQNTATNSTLAVLPSGITLNFLAKRVNPTPDLFWDPNAMTVFGQDKMTEMFEQNYPDYILVLEQDQRDLGVGYFGSYPGYGVKLMEWIVTNYEVNVRFGSEPLHDGRFGVWILKHRAAKAP